ncbi:MAG: DUF2330 domain-containing protein [bacterium]
MRWLTLVAVLAGLASADGGMVGPEGVEVVEHNQTAVIRHFGGIEELTIATGFQAYSGFAWIVPAPAHPAVDSAPGVLFAALYSYCRPILRGGGFACGYAISDDLGASEPGRSVEQLEGGIIGEWEWALFRADEPDTLTAYLDSLGYYLPPGVSGAFQHYIDKGWQYFVVCRVREDTRMPFGGHVGIRLTFASDSIVYPLRISRISSTAGPVTLYVLAEHRQMFDGARLKFSGRVGPATFPDLPGFADRDCRLTKLVRYYEPGGMEDICLRRAPDDREFRDVEFHGARDGVLPVFALFAAALLARRRRDG